MAESKAILDALVKAQSESVDNLSQTSSKMRELVGKPDGIQKARDMYAAWFNRQEEITQEMSKALKDQVMTDKTPGFIKEWIETQERFSEKWMSAFKDMSANFSGEKMLDFYKENANEMFTVWKTAFDRFSGMFTTSFGMENYDPSTQVKEMHDNFVESARRYIKMMDEQAEKVKESMQAK